jgi:hypothetical protein
LAIASYHERESLDVGLPAAPSAELPASEELLEMEELGVLELPVAVVLLEGVCDAYSNE